MPPNIVAQIQQQQQLGGQLAFSAPAAFPSRVGLQKYKSRHLLRSCYLENNVPSSAFLEGLSTLAFCLEGSLCLCPWKPSQQSDAHLPSFCSYPLVMTHRITVPNRPGKIDPAEMQQSLTKHVNMCQHDTTSFIQYRLQQITYEYTDCKWLKAQNGPTKSPSIYLGYGKESIRKLCFFTPRNLWFWGCWWWRQIWKGNWNTKKEKCKSEDRSLVNIFNG